VPNSPLIMLSSGGVIGADVAGRNPVRMIESGPAAGALAAAFYAERAESPDGVYAEADFITIHLPKTPETEGWLNAEVFAKCRDGVRILNVARGPLVVDADLQAPHLAAEDHGAGEVLTVRLEYTRKS